jgi:hypothetical protein
MWSAVCYYVESNRKEELLMVIIGQIMGWLAAILTFASYQCKDHKKLIAVQTLSTLSICISYLFLNAWSGMLLNIVCLARNFIIYR